MINDVTNVANVANVANAGNIANAANAKPLQQVQGINNTAPATNTENVQPEEQGKVYSVPAVDSFEKTSESNVDAGLYSESTATEPVDVDMLEAERMVSFQNMIAQMAGGQMEAATTGYDSDIANEVTAVSGSESVESAKEAVSAISADSQWSAENVASNILDTAKSLADGDDSKFELLKEAVIKGFSAAADAWGGEMPSVTSTTYDLVMEGFDTWEAEINGTTTEPTTSSSSSVSPGRPAPPPPPPPGSADAIKEDAVTDETEVTTVASAVSAEEIEEDYATSDKPVNTSVKVEK